MRKLIASINMTLDGFCDHEAGIADEALHEKANNLLRNIDTLIMGRITYQLMEEGWPPIVAKPTGVKAVDDFALLMDDIKKVVVSNTLKNVSWKNTTIANESLEQTVIHLKQQQGKDIGVGGPSLIQQLTVLGLIDEYRLVMQPIILGKGLTLFKDIQHRLDLKLIGTDVLESGVVELCYVPTAPR